MTIAVSPDGLPALVLNADYRPLSYYPLVALVLAGRDQGGVPRPRQHRRRIRALGLLAVLLHEAAERRQPEELCEAVAQSRPSRGSTCSCAIASSASIAARRKTSPSTTSCRATAAARRPGRTSWRRARPAISGRAAAAGAGQDVAAAEAVPADGARPAQQRPAVSAQLSARKLDGLSLLGCRAGAVERSGFGESRHGSSADSPARRGRRPAPGTRLATAFQPANDRPRMRSAALSQDGGMIASIWSSTPPLLLPAPALDRAAIGRAGPPAPFDAGVMDAEIEAVDHQQRRRRGAAPRVSQAGQRSAADSSARPSAERRHSRACAARGRACRGCSRRDAGSRARCRPSPPWRASGKPPCSSCVRGGRRIGCGHAIVIVSAGVGRRAIRTDI